MASAWGTTGAWNRSNRPQSQSVMLMIALLYTRLEPKFWQQGTIIPPSSELQSKAPQWSPAVCQYHSVSLPDTESHAGWRNATRPQASRPQLGSHRPGRRLVCGSIKLSTFLDNLGLGPVQELDMWSAQYVALQTFRQSRLSPKINWVQGDKLGNQGWR